MLERCDWTNLMPNELNELLLNVFDFLVGFKDNKSDRYFTLKLINFSNYSCF